MSKILHIQASPRGDRSASTTVAKDFLAAYKGKNPGDTIETLDLWKADLPPFDGDTLNAKYAVMHGQSPTGGQVAAWEAVTKIAEHFKAADKFVFSLPMWNFGIPYRLKHYIDLLVQPGLTVGFSPDKGYWGLVTGKPAVLIFSRGGDYTPGTPMEAYDLQSKYLKQVLGFIGIADVTDIFVEGAEMDKAKALDAGKKKALEIAAKF
jgi:FMN-dependent NADH-azoreductase